MRDSGNMNKNLHLFLLEHGRMGVYISDIERDDGGGGQGWSSLILGFNNNFILLYFLEQILGWFLDICVNVCV